MKTINHIPPSPPTAADIEIFHGSLLWSEERQQYFLVAQTQAGGYQLISFEGNRLHDTPVVKDFDASSIQPLSAFIGKNRILSVYLGSCRCIRDFKITVEEEKGQ